MRWALLGWVVLAALGCGDRPCKSWHGKTEVSETMRGFAPPSATMCGGSSPTSVRFDMKMQDNAFVAVRSHLQAMGYEVRHAIDGKTVKSLEMAKGDEHVSVMVQGEGAFDLVVLSYSKK